MSGLLHQRTVLVVDDDANLVFAVTEALADSGYDVVAAPDGHAAITRISRDRPDLIVLDLRMPFMNGVEVLDWLKKHSLHIPTIVATTDDEWTARELGVAAKLTKPFTLDQLLAAIGIALPAQ